MDPQQQQAADAMKVMAPFFLIFGLIGLAFIVFGIFCLWRIFSKAGLSGALSLLVLIPGVGWIIVLCLLAFMDWKVTPIPQGYSGPPSGGSYPSPYQSAPVFPTTPTYPNDPPPPPTQL